MNKPAEIALRLPNTTLNRSSAIFREGLSLAEWIEEGQRLMVIEGSLLWWLGDWFIYGERFKPTDQDKGEERQAKASRYKVALELFDYNYTTLRHAAWVARAVPSCRRRHSLSWSHHMEVARLTPEQQDYFLGEAEKHKWPREQLRREIRRQLADKPIEHGPVIKFIPSRWVLEGQRWFADQLNAKPIDQWDPQRRQEVAKSLKPIVDIYMKLTVLEVSVEEGGYHRPADKP